jgi:molecular chaperone DnaK
MTRTLAVDFGANNTVIAVYDGRTGEVRNLPLPDWSKPVSGEQNGKGDSWVIPSLIHYAPRDERLHGEQVRLRNLTGSPGTIRWMRHYIQMGSPVRVPVNGSFIDYRTAGTDFLVPLLIRAMKEYRLKGAEVAFTMPLEASEKYEEWIGIVAAHAGISCYRLIDEPSAAMYGYQIPLGKDAAIMVFDFGGSSLDVSVVMPEIEAGGPRQICRVLGRARDDIGGATIDQWLYREIANRVTLSSVGPSGQGLSGPLRNACERAKEQLSSEDEVTVRIQDAPVNRTLEARISREEFETLLNTHELPARIQRIVGQALQAAALKGFSEDRIGYVLMTGGSSSIPAVQSVLKERFGRDRVFCSNPSGAVACGAALFMGGQESADYIRHDYGIRFWNSRIGEYDFRIIVRRGTCFPSSTKTARFFIKSTYDGQTHMGISIFEMGTGSHSDQVRELISEPGGGYRLVETLTENQDQVKTVNRWMNERNPTLLIANPPAKKGEITFEVWFDVDGNKRLLLSSRDARTGRMVMERAPVAQLS